MGYMGLSHYKTVVCPCERVHGVFVAVVRSLRLDRNELTADSAGAIASLLRGSPELRVLGLAWNHLGGAGVNLVLEPLTFNTGSGLHELDLSWNNVKTDGAMVRRGHGQHTHVPRVCVTSVAWRCWFGACPVDRRSPVHEHHVENAPAGAQRNPFARRHRSGSRLGQFVNPVRP